MLCDLCHKNRATVHLMEIVKGKVMELNICQQCAHLKAGEFEFKLNTPEGIGSFGLNTEIDSKDECLHCSFCGLQLVDFKKNGYLGCAHCYTVFKSQLIGIIKKIQGHYGYSSLPFCDALHGDNRCISYNLYTHHICLGSVLM